MSVSSFIASRIASGILIGAGFAVTMLVVFFGASKMSLGTIRSGGSSESTYTSTEQRKYSPEVGLRIVSHEPADTATRLVVRGVLANDSDQTWEDVSLSADYFDANGKFVDRCEEWVRGKIPPHSQINFKATCGGCDGEEQRSQYATYKIAIVDARSDEMITITKRITNDGRGQKSTR